MQYKAELFDVHLSGWEILNSKLPELHVVQRIGLGT